MTGTDRTYRLLDRLRVLQLWLAALAMIVMMGVTVTDVVLRYLLNSPIRGSYDLVEVTLVVFVFHGLSTAFLFRRHIVIDLIDLALPPRAVAVLVRVADVLSVLALAVLAYAMITPTMQAYDYGDRKLELQLPIYVLWIVALSGMMGAILCACGALLTPVSSRAHEESR
jgi:TRAP-type C4-dicarboxylate transport system permease small subunit